MGVLGNIGLEAVSVAVDSVGGLLGSIRSLFTGQEVLTSDDRGKIETMLAALEEKVIELKAQVVKAQSSVIIAEAQGESWLQRNWRPLTMMSFLFVILYQAIIVSIFNAPSIDMSGIPDQMWRLLEIGLGGYIVGRSVEKSVKSWREGDK